MKVKELLNIKLECDSSEKVSCEGCPLFNRVNWAPEIESNGALESIAIRLSPCDIIEELAPKVHKPRKKRDRGTGK